MMRRNLMVMSCLLLLAGGCGSKFAGEWVEEGTYDKQGVFQETQGQRRLALKFEPPSTVRFGTLVNRARIVDSQSVQTDTYMTMQDRQVAGFGSVMARVRDGYLVATISGDIVMRFSRVTGQSVFPPAAVLPSLAKASEQSQPQPELTTGTPDKNALGG
jgi:hypothetical protein